VQITTLDGVKYVGNCLHELVGFVLDNLHGRMLSHLTHLIACGRVIARKRKSEQVDVGDLRRACTYFMDEKRSVQWLKEQQGLWCLMRLERVLRRWI